jgi:hypothetical protein
MRNADNFPGDILGRQNVIDAAGGNRAHGHLRLHGRIFSGYDGDGAEALRAIKDAGGISCSLVTTCRK